jgi:hypothetical protein
MWAIIVPNKRSVNFTKPNGCVSNELKARRRRRDKGECGKSQVAKLKDKKGI